MRVLPRRGESLTHARAQVRDLGIDEARQCAPACECFRARLLGPHRLNAGEVTEIGLPSDELVETPQLAATDTRGHGCLERLLQNSICHRFRLSCEGCRVD